MFDVLRQFITPNQSLAFGLIALTVLIFFWVMLRNRNWPHRAHFAQTIEAIAVTLALTLAVLEYSLHYQGDIDRKKQAVIDILKVTIGSPILDPAFAALYDHKPEDVLTMPIAEFDHRISPLSDIFWAVGACVAAEQCDSEVTRKVFCYDFITYKFAYERTHAPDKLWQNFGDPRLAVFEKCDKNDHRFRLMQQASH